MSLITFEDFFNLVKDDVVDIIYDVSNSAAFQETETKTLMFKATLNANDIPEDSEFYTRLSDHLNIINKVINGEENPFEIETPELINGSEAPDPTRPSDIAFDGPPEFLKVYSPDLQFSVNVKISNILEIL